MTATLTPVHGRDCSIRLERYRLEAGRWVLCGSSRMVPSGRAGVWAGVVLLGAGDWRVRTSFAGDRDHLPGTSEYATVVSE